MPRQTGGAPTAPTSPTEGGGHDFDSPLTSSRIESQYGIPERNQERFQGVAEHENLLIDVRPTNPDSVRWLNEGAIPKPQDIKAKTVNEYDLLLCDRLPRDAQGLVALFEPTMPQRHEVDLTDSQWSELEQRYRKRMTEWAYLNDQIGYGDQEGRFRVTDDALVQGVDRNGEWRPITGDHDIFDIRHPDGSRLSPEEEHQVISDMRDRDMGVQHGPHMYWDPPAGSHARTEIYEPIVRAHQEGPNGEPLVRFAPGRPPRLVWAEPLDAGTNDAPTPSTPTDTRLTGPTPGTPPPSGTPPPANPQPTPANGEPTPTAGQPTPAAGQLPPSPGHPAPSSAQPAPSSGPPVPNAGQPAPSGGQPVPNAAQPASTGGSAAPSGGRPVPSGDWPTSPGGQPTPAGQLTPAGQPTPAGGQLHPSASQPAPSRGQPAPSGSRPSPNVGQPASAGGTSDGQPASSGGRPVPPGGQLGSSGGQPPSSGGEFGPSAGRPAPSAASYGGRPPASRVEGGVPVVPGSPTLSPPAGGQAVASGGGPLVSPSSGEGGPAAGERGGPEGSDGGGEEGAGERSQGLPDGLREVWQASVETPAGRALYGADEAGMRDLARAVPAEPGRYVLDAHGDVDGIRVGERRLGVDEVAALVRNDPGWDGRTPVMLLSCDVGQGDFAARLAERLGVPVVAPTTQAWSDSQGRVFAATSQPGPDGRPTPTWPPDGAWNAHHPGGEVTPAGRDGHIGDVGDTTTPPTDAAARGDSPPADDATSDGESTDGDSPSDGDSASNGQTPGGQTPRGETPGGDTRSGQIQNSETQSGQAPSGETQSGETPSEESPGGQTPGGQTQSGESPSGEPPGGESPGGQIPGGETRSGETPEGESGDRAGPRGEFPGEVGEDGVRRFERDGLGARYGDEVLGDVFRALPPEQQQAVRDYTQNSGPFNDTLRLTDPSALDDLIASWRDDGYRGWGLFEVTPGRVPTLEDLYAAIDRPDLTPDQRDLLERVFDADDPAHELDGILRNEAGMRGTIMMVFGSWPTPEDVHARIAMVDDALARPLPETVEVLRALQDLSFIPEFDPDDPEALEGVRWTEEGFTSSSLGARFAHIDGLPPEVRMRLEVPAGTPALWVGENSFYPDQRELILARPLTYEISEVRVLPNGKMEVRARVVPSESSDSMES
ncbi:ADP-ribosyltransferase [Thermomonospora umbrina]|uniref:ADP-ribosyltransferase n=1 Tax=Thermomonospora umbrina TaxID=111806 RepID=UPI000E25DC0C|nr:ADP-ribosyltransferase [Thermomonospora umbrina]